MSSFGRKDGGGRRSAARARGPLTAVFTTVTRSHAATLVDVSADGARLCGDDLPAVGELAELRIGGVHAFGVIRWVRGRECGLLFDIPLDAEEVEWLSSQVSCAAGLPPEIRAAYDDWTVGFAR